MFDSKKAFQSDFATIYKNREAEDVETKVTATQVPEKLLEFDKKHYQKKFPFERSQYH